MSSLAQILSLQGLATRSQTFTSSGSFTVPANVYTIFLSMCGAGGGSLFYSGYYNGAPGAGGYVLDYPVSVSPGDTLTITIGSGGTSRMWNGGSWTGSATATSGGATSVYIGASELLTVYGGSVNSYSSSSAMYNFNGGAGGYPNGAGGAAQDGTAGGVGLRKLESSVYGGGHSSTGAIWATGPLANASLNNSASTPFDGYGRPAAASSIATAQNGVAILKWVG